VSFTVWCTHSAISVGRAVRGPLIAFEVRVVAAADEVIADRARHIKLLHLLPSFSAPGRLVVAPEPKELLELVMLELERSNMLNALRGLQKDDEFIVRQ
jgi:hypothetical protein